MVDKVILTKEILIWARKTARMSVEESAGKASVDPERLISWEKGDDYPTMRQAELLAKAYRRPLAMFFLPDVPYDFMPLQDFRLPKSVPLSTASLFIIREMQQKQEWISGMLKENGEDPLSFIGKFSIRSNPETIAKNILTVLSIKPGAYGSEAIMRQWIRKAEDAGIFISRASFIHSHLLLKSEEMQGFAIADQYAPFIFINSEDWDAPQLFTLVHELAHLWIAKSGISNNIEPDIARHTNADPVEIFCNEVAAHALMPAALMANLTNQHLDNGEAVYRQAQKLGISSFAFLVRAKNMGILTSGKYQSLKKQADEGFKLFQEKEAAKKAAAKLKSKEKPSGPDANFLLTLRNGFLFTKVVIDAFRGGLILATEASSLLNAKVTNFPKLEAFLK